MTKRSIHPLAGQQARPEDLYTREQITTWYTKPDGPVLPIKNGTSGHRGHTGVGFSQLHVAAMTQALVDIRRERGTFGPVLPEELKEKPLGPVVMGKDVRFASDLAQQTAVEVFAGNGMKVLIHRGGRSTPTPVVSHAILTRVAQGEKVEGVIITASHNPPEDAGYKSNGLTVAPIPVPHPLTKRATTTLSIAPRSSGCPTRPRWKRDWSKRSIWSPLTSGSWAGWLIWI